jgi:large subunit ribosomal protein L22
MEAKAINRYIGSSPRKMRLVIDLIRGKSVDEALHILHFSPKHASKVAEKVLRSAVSNLQNKDGGGRLEPENMVVKTVTVDPGMSMKRVLPAPMGRAFRVRKRSHHLTIVVAAKQETLAPAKAAGRKKKEEPKPESKKAGAAPKARKTVAAAPKKKAEADDTK